jgi:hypothetical protein
MATMAALFVWRTGGLVAGALALGIYFIFNYV